MKYPTPWQQKTMWAALSAVFVALLIVIVCSVVWVAANVISFLQPILIPVAIAAILAYLLDPVVTRVCRGGLSRTKGVLLVFALGFLFLVGLVAWLAPTISMQSTNFARELPNHTQRARDRVVDLIVQYNRAFGATTGPKGKSSSPYRKFCKLAARSARSSSSPSATPAPSPSPTAPEPSYPATCRKHCPGSCQNNPGRPAASSKLRSIN